MDKPIAICVDPLHVKKVWHLVEHLIRPAIENVGVSNFDDVADDVLCGSSLLWLGWNGQQIISAGVTELTGDVCTLVAYGGRREDHLLDTIEQYARTESCTTMRVIGRKGWVRVLKHYHQPYVILERHLDGRQVI